MSLRFGRLKEPSGGPPLSGIAPASVYGRSDLATVLMGEGRFAEALHEFEQEAPEADQLEWRWRITPWAENGNRRRR